MTMVDRDEIFLLFALTESARALKALAEIERLSALREQIHPVLGRRELQSVFDQIRLALQFAANTSKVFWPHQQAAVRGDRLRRLIGLPVRHPLGDRRLRNHVEHMDERLDDWTSESPRPYLSSEWVIHRDCRDTPRRDLIIESTAVVYDEAAHAVLLFGDTFPLKALAEAILDVQHKISAKLSEIASPN